MGFAVGFFHALLLGLPSTVAEFSAAYSLCAVNVDGAMLARMIDLNYSVPQRLISSQSRGNFHSAHFRPSIR
jgi:hypothetical protein